MQSVGPIVNFDEQAFAAASALGDAISRSLGIARLLLDAGHMIDLSDLDRSVGLLCAKTLDLPPGHARAMRPHLASLVDEIDALIRAISQHLGAG